MSAARRLLFHTPRADGATEVLGVMLLVAVGLFSVESRSQSVRLVRGWRRRLRFNGMRAS